MNARQQSAITLSAILFFSAAFVTNVRVEAAPANAMPKNLNAQLLQAVWELSNKAAIVYSVRHQQTNADSTAPHAADGDAGALTAEAIASMGPKEWTRQKIEQLSTINGKTDPRLRSILVGYIESLPMSYESGKRETSQLDLDTEKKLVAVPAKAKISFLHVIGAAYDLTKEALLTAKQKQPIAYKTVEKETKPSLTVGAYYDDIDGMFDDAKSKIQSTFDKFAQKSISDGSSNQLINASVQSQDLKGSMNQASANAVKQIGSTMATGYRPALNELQQLKAPAKSSQ